MPVRLFTLGRVALERDGRAIEGGAAQRRRLALLALLAVAGEAGLSRDKVVGYLWAELPERRAQKVLNTAVSALRGELGKDAVRVVQRRLHLDRTLLRTDVGEFEERLARGDEEGAVAVYGGDFLDGFFVDDAPEFEQWVSIQRLRLSRALLRALELVAARAEAAGDCVAAAGWWERAVQHDTGNSRVVLRCMDALARTGEHVRARQVGREYQHWMREEGIEPDPQVEGMIQSLPPTTPLSGAGRLRFPDLDGLPADLEPVGVAGEGSVSTVYVAREPALARQVAVKVLAPRHAADDIARRRFEREAQAAARIQHPNVATVYRTGRLASGIPYFVMPYIGGGSLEDRLAATGPLPLPDARRHIAQLAAALAAAHRLGIVHRDVRPANALYDRDTDRILLTDFGIAAVLDRIGGTVLRLTGAGERLGTPAYASPEQLRGDTVTDRADVYSLGVVAFELLTGRLPYDARTPVEMIAAHARAEPRRVSEFREVGAELDELVRRCLDKQAEQRPFAADVAESLRER